MSQENLFSLISWQLSQWDTTTECFHPVS